jgi:hypothetical protein
MCVVTLHLYFLTIRRCVHNKACMFLTNFTNKVTQLLHKSKHINTDTFLIRSVCVFFSYRTCVLTLLTNATLYMLKHTNIIQKTLRHSYLCYIYTYITIHIHVYTYTYIRTYLYIYVYIPVLFAKALRP